MQAEDEKEQPKQKPRACSTARIALYSALATLLTTLAFLAIDKDYSYGDHFSIVGDILTVMFYVIFLLSLVVLITATATVLSLPFIKFKAKSFSMVSLAFLLTIISLGLVFSTMGRVRPIAKHIVCAINLKGLGTAIIFYANDYNDELPTTENWCDLLITKMDVNPKSFICASTDFIKGESSYALNENITGLKLSEIPEDVVLLFETSIGQYEVEPNFPITSRKYFKEHPDWFDDYDESLKVREKCWNQVGGAETLTTENHQGRGCNILFADGHAEFVKTEDIPKLRWKL